MGQFVEADYAQQFAEILKGLSEAEIRMIESVAGDCLDAWVTTGSLFNEVRKSNSTRVKSRCFHAANRALMQQRQEETDPEDRRRRKYQMEVLEEVKARAFV